MLGPGRMREPAQLLANVERIPDRARALEGVLLTAGPTREAMRSGALSQQPQLGKDGLCARRGGACRRRDSDAGQRTGSARATGRVKLIAVESAQQMHDAVMQQVEHRDAFYCLHRGS